MTTESYVQLPAKTNWHELWSVSGWLPAPQQVSSAVQLRLAETTQATADAPEVPDNPATTSMRQGMGLVVISGLLAGLLPFLWNWIIAMRAGAALPLVQLERMVAGRVGSSPNLPMAGWHEAAQIIVGLDPALPAWLAALLSALGDWINQPLNWLAFWLVYGLGVLIMSKWLNTPTTPQPTLQHFYAATSYAFVPLIVTNLGMLPCVGWLVNLAAGAWGFVVYLHAVQAVTGLQRERALMAMLLPLGLGLLLALVLFGTVAVSLLGVTFR
jgi:hypothetical protein